MKMSILFVAAVAIIGCGATSPGSAANPAAPLATSGPSTRAQTTRIRGTVLSNVNTAARSIHFSAASTAKPAAGVRVSLVGTGRSATSDAQGHFTLENAPLGKQRLQFEGQGSQAGLDVDLHEGKELHLAVELKGQNDVNLICETEEADGNNNDGQHTSPAAPGNACDQGNQNDGTHGEESTDDGS